MQHSFETKQLLATVEKFYGQNVADNYDCIKLADIITNAINEPISSQTLRRLFDIIPNSSKPTNNTLNILSKYVGFDDFKNFSTYLSRQPSDAKTDLTHLIKAYKNNSTQDITMNRTYFHEHLSTGIAKFIVTDEGRFTELIAKFSNDTIAIRQIIECGIFYDLLGKEWFMRGVRLFCRNSPLYHHKVFIKSLEFQSNWLQKNYDKAGSFLNEIEADIFIMEKKFGVIWALEGCLLAERMIWANYTKNQPKIEQLIIEATNLIEENLDFVFENDMDVNMFYFIFLDTLNWGGMSHIGLRFTKYFEKFDYQHHSLFQTGVESTFSLRLAFMYMANGDNANAKIHINKFDINKIEDSKLNYNFIQYYIVLLRLETNKTKIKKLKVEIERLVEVTGFTRFLDFIV